MTVKEIKEEGIEFDNGFLLTHDHWQDCCECVYADWKNMQVLTNVFENSFDISSLEFDETKKLKEYIEVKESIGFTIESNNGIKLLVSCYDVQNGYYSNNLTLQLKDASSTLDEMDVTGGTKFVEC